MIVGQFRAYGRHEFAGGALDHVDELAGGGVAGLKDVFGGVAIVEAESGYVLFCAVADDALLLEQRLDFANEVYFRVGAEGCGGEEGVQEQEPWRHNRFDFMSLLAG